MTKCIIKNILCLFFKKWYYHLLSWIIPFILGIIFLYGFGFEYNSFSFYSLPIITTTFIAIPILINEIKNLSNFNETYKNKLISWKLTFFLPIIFFIYLMIVSVIFILIETILFAFTYNNVYNNTISLLNFFSKINFINWVEILFYFGYGAILGLSFSFFINSIIINKTILIPICAVITIFLISFSGIIPYSLLFNNNISLGFSYLSIYRYICVNGMLSTLGCPVFCFKYNYTFNTFSINHIDVLMNFTIPFIVISLFISISAIKFRWFKNNAILKPTNNISNYNKYHFIIIYVLLTISFAILIIGIVLTIISNYYKNSNFPWILNSYPKYIVGSIFIILSIISLSCGTGILIKNIYVNKQLLKIKKII